MRVSFDSNVWEKRIFNCKCAPKYDPILAALEDRRLEGFICAAGFRIEAIEKKNRAAYFAKSYIDCRLEGSDIRDGVPYLKMSFGPLDERHPGLHVKQAPKLQSALATGIRLMRGLNWTDLPEPQEILDPAIYVIETNTAAHTREQRQIDVSDLIDAREVGRGAVARIYRDHPGDEKKFIKACAEWADGELVAAHIAYENGILCTNDCGKNAAGPSIFNCKNRSWLTAKYGVVFKTTDQLLAEILK